MTTMYCSEFDSFPNMNLNYCCMVKFILRDTGKMLTIALVIQTDCLMHNFTQKCGILESFFFPPTVKAQSISQSDCSFDMLIKWI